MLKLIDKVVGLNDWPELGPQIKETLMDLLLTYIKSERVEGDNPDTRNTIAYHMWIVNNLISDLIEFEKSNPKMKVA